MPNFVFQKTSKLTNVLSQKSKKISKDKDKFKFINHCHSKRVNC